MNPLYWRGIGWYTQWQGSRSHRVDRDPTRPPRHEVTLPWTSTERANNGPPEVEV